MTPLVDMVFILLIFFLLTASFVQDAGIDVERPHSETRQSLEQDAIVVGLSRAGEVVFQGHRVGLGRLRALVERELGMQPGRGVVIVADRGCSVESLVDIIDAARAGGARRVAVATERD